MSETEKLGYGWKYTPTAYGKLTPIRDGVIVEENTPEEFFNNPKSDRAKKFLKEILMAFKLLKLVASHLIILCVNYKLKRMPEMS